MEKLIPGLEGVPIMESEVGFIDGQKGVLEYRGIPIEELAEKSTYEEVSYLLLWGKLPTREELAKFDHDLRTHRRIKYRLTDLIKCLPENGHPMDALQTGVAGLGMFYPAHNVSVAASNWQATVRLIGGRIRGVPDDDDLTRQRIEERRGFLGTARTLRDVSRGEKHGGVAHLTQCLT